MDFDKKVVQLDINDILPNRFQPRIKFNEDSINELCESIREHGVIQPIVVRKMGDKYEIIAGERRFKASLLAGKNYIPAVITELNDKDSAEVALIENVQRRDLTPIEEAISYKKILDMGFMTQEDLAKKLGKTQSTVANKLRLLNLDEDVQEALLEEKISERHARSLLRLNDSNQQKMMLKKITDERLTVRKADDFIAKILKGENVFNKPESVTTTQNVEIPTFNNAFLPNENLIEKPVENITNISLEKPNNFMGNDLNIGGFSSELNPNNYVEPNENELMKDVQLDNNNFTSLVLNPNYVEEKNENTNVFPAFTENKNENINVMPTFIENTNDIVNNNEINNIEIPNVPNVEIGISSNQLNPGVIQEPMEYPVIQENLTPIISASPDVVNSEVINETVPEIVVPSETPVQVDTPMVIPSYPDVEDDEAVPTFDGNMDTDFVNIPAIEEKHEEPVVIIEEEPNMNNEQYIANSNFMNQNMQYPNPMMQPQTSNEFNPFDLSNNNVANNDFNIPSSPIEESPQMGYAPQSEPNYNDNNNFIPLSANNLGIEEPLVNMPSYDNSINPGFMDIDKIEKQAVDISNFGQSNMSAPSFTNDEPVYNIDQELNNVEIFPTDVPILRPSASEGNVQDFEEKKEIQPGKFFSLPVEDEVDKNKELELETNPFEFNVPNNSENMMTLNLEGQPQLKTLDEVSQFKEDPVSNNQFFTSSLMNEQNNMMNSMNNANNPVNQFGLPVQEAFAPQMPQQPVQQQPSIPMQNPSMGYGFAPQQVVPTQTMIPPAEQNNMNMASYMNQSMMMQPQMAQPTKNINMAYAAIKECVQKIQALGFNVNTEDFDFENMYQIMFRIEK
ncbi:MAG: ParB/RepB/Spo0J family partition protein [Bacilli bacterium]|nr:ParB/RepB/Spo0J family partition protein [Bacilli bacterium]